MNPAEINLQRKTLILDLFRQGCGHLTNMQRPVVMDAGFFRPFEVLGRAALQPFCSDYLVVETDGADGAGRISCPASPGAGGVLTEQATHGFIVDVHSFQLFFQS